jgi:hypothetical protein
MGNLFQKHLVTLARALSCKLGTDNLKGSFGKFFKVLIFIRQAKFYLPVYTSKWIGGLSCGVK